MTLSDLMFLVKNTRLFVEGGGKPPVIIDVGDDDAFSTQDITDILDKMAERYDAPRDVMGRDLDEILTRLKGIGALEE